MLRTTAWGLTVLSALFLGTVQAAEKSSLSKENFTFGTLTPPSEVQVRVQAANWLKEVGKTDAAARQAFDTIWAQADKSALDRLAETFALGSREAATALAEARTATASAPTALPTVLQDAKKSAFFRANLALSYAKALTNRRVYEEALDTFKLFKAEQVVDPAAFLFHKAVAEHGLMLKKDAEQTIVKLLDDVPAAPERYKTVAALMHFDMVSWKEKDLADVARKMDNIERRLRLERGGKKTQKIQKDVIARLEEIIKELENQQDKDCNCNGGNCPGGAQAKNGNKPGNTNQPSSPMNDSNIATNSGPGQVDAKRIKELADVWGKLPARERENHMRELVRDIDPRYREIIQDYFRKLSAQAER